MAIPTILPCDGCGQLASAEHLARRLQRLEWATRFRPIHVQALLLSSSAPENDTEFLYGPEVPFAGHAGQILDALVIPMEGKSPEEVLGEFQKRGLVLASLLECPFETAADALARQEILKLHLAHAVARIRRSFKPKRVLVISPELQPFLTQLTESTLGCPVFYTPLTAQKPENAEIAAFRASIPALASHGT